MAQFLERIRDIAVTVSDFINVLITFLFQTKDVTGN